MLNFNVECINQNRALVSQNFQEPEANEKGKADFTHVLPPEMTLEIFSHLNSQELRKCFRVNKTWKALASAEDLWEALLLKKATFGKKQWETYFGDVGEVPPLPNDIQKILNSSCPFWSRKKVGETHVLVYIPETVNGEPLNLITLDDLVEDSKGGYPTQYEFIWNEFMYSQGYQATTKSHWVLMTKDVIKGSRNKKYPDQQALIAGFANYEVPNALDAVICSFMHHIHSGERLFDAKKRRTYTHCQEKVQGNSIVVGGFSPDGLNVYYHCFASLDVGVAALRKFSF